MKATEARKAAIAALQQKHGEKCLEVLSEVYYKIKQAVDNGDFSVNVKVAYNHQDFVLNQLSGDGYKIEITFENFKISW